jgi:hypothetical protein
MILYPQLPHGAAEHLMDERRKLTVQVAATASSSEHPDMYFTPTGGTRVDADALRRLRDTLIGIAQECGYPDPERGHSFDKRAAIFLHSAMQLSAAEAAKPGVWEFLACVLLCDLVRWRFPGDHMGSPPERFLASRRNTFQRLWWRAFVFYDSGVAEPYHLLDELGEDEAVQIMERPFLAGSRTLSRTVARELFAAAVRHPDISRRILIREAQKRMRRLGAFISFESVDETSLLPFVHDIFERVAAASG